MKRRILRILLIALVVVVFAGYFAFTTFFFSPFEGSYELDVSTLVPREVDFFAAKGDLERDFDPFPELAVTDEVLATEWGRTFFESDDWLSSDWRKDLVRLRQEIDRSLTMLPEQVDPLGVLGGKDAAIAGFFAGAQPQDSDWAIYARTNWMGKLGVSALAHPGWFGLEEQGLTVRENEKSFTLINPDFPQALHVTRVLDVLVVGNRQELVERVHGLAQVQGADSMGSSARYRDNVDIADERDGSELELFCDMRAFAERYELPRVPDPSSESLAGRLTARLFQLASLRELIGVAGFGGGPRIRLYGEFSGELITAEQKRVYSRKAIEREEFQEAARYAPEDAYFFMHASLPVTDVLQMLREAMESFDRDILDDTARSVWGYADAVPLLNDFGAAVGDDVIIITRTNDYVDTKELAPVHDDTPVFAWAILFEMNDADALDGIRKKVTDNQQHFGLQGPTGGGGVYRNRVSGGFDVYEFHQVGVPGTGHISTCRASDKFIVSNSHLLIGHILKTHARGRSALPPAERARRVRVDDRRQAGPLGDERRDLDGPARRREAAARDRQPRGRSRGRGQLGHREAAHREADPQEPLPRARLAEHPAGEEGPLRHALPGRGGEVRGPVQARAHRAVRGGLQPPRDVRRGEQGDPAPGRPRPEALPLLPALARPARRAGPVAEERPGKGRGRRGGPQRPRCGARNWSRTSTGITPQDP